MKTVLITGATANTGLAIAKKFAKEGYAVAITSRRRSDAEETALALEKEFGVTSRGYSLELADVESIKAAFEQVERDFGKLDTFVANAANLGIDFGLLNTDEESFRAITDSNIKGTFFCCQAAAEIMKRHGGGAIVTIGSVQALGAVRGRTVS